MTRVRLALLFLWLPLIGLAAEPLTKASVFVDSQPLGARITVDGQLLALRTPTILRGLTAGPHTIEVQAPGYRPSSSVVTVADGQVPVLSPELSPLSLILAFPGNDQLVTGTESRDTADQVFQFPAGDYRYTNTDGAARLTPVFPDEGLLTVAGWALTLTAGATLIATGSDIYHGTTGWYNSGGHNGPSALTMALAMTSLFELPWYLSVAGRKARFERETAPTLTPGSAPFPLASALWDQGEASLQAGDLKGAEDLFTQIVRDHPTSRLAPGAWFRLARIHTVTGRIDLARGEFRLVAEVLPQAAYHDRARKALADLFEDTDPAQALDHLDAMVLADGFFEAADLDVQRARLKAALEAKLAS